MENHPEEDLYWEKEGVKCSSRYECGEDFMRVYFLSSACDETLMSPLSQLAAAIALRDKRR